MEPYARPSCRHSGNPWAKHRIKQFLKIQGNVSLNPTLFIMGHPGDDVAGAPASGVMETFQKPASSILTPLQPLLPGHILGFVSLWSSPPFFETPGYDSAVASSYPPARSVPCSQPTCCLTSRRRAISSLFFLLVSPGGFISLANPMMDRSYACRAMSILWLWMLLLCSNHHLLLLKLAVQLLW